MYALHSLVETGNIIMYLWNMETRYGMMRRRRTEHAREQRRKTGTNDFRDKEYVIEQSDLSSTITSASSIENCLVEFVERRG